ncbi:MAG: DNA-processing protein DprA [Patescibacteria group bacterium]|nr:DNA-processing protein DprA [Patescibacteria group bacterium]
MNNDLKYWNALNQNLKIGARRFKKIYNYFSDMEQAWHADSLELSKAGLEDKVIDYILVKRPTISIDFEMERLEKENIQIITIKDKKYPKLLKEIYDPPALLYVRGELKEQDEFAISVVGTRKISQYGKQVVPDIVHELASNKITIISGLALGTDTFAHQAAIAAQGRTIAVLGSGLDRQHIYPYCNKSLSEIISQHGAIISEYPLGTLPLKQHFPARNRIVSGMSLGILIIEAPMDSGALITAKFGLEHNRDIFSIPGSIYSENSKGPNNLIKQGAKLITCAQDILDELNLSLATSYQQTKKIVPESKEEEILLNIITKEPLHIDKIVQQSKMPASQVSASLTIMEMKGKVRNLGAMNYVLAR